MNFTKNPTETEVVDNDITKRTPLLLSQFDVFAFGDEWHFFWCRKIWNWKRVSIINNKYRVRNSELKTNQDVFIYYSWEFALGFVPFCTRPNKAWAYI